MRDDVIRARDRQTERFAGNAVRYNAQMSSREVREHCVLNKSCQQMLRHSVEEMGLSARAHDKILRVARTIADVAGDTDINEMHLAEAIGPLGGNKWLNDECGIRLQGYRGSGRDNFDRSAHQAGQKDGAKHDVPGPFGRKRIAHRA